jgi:hypothetical protein
MSEMEGFCITIAMIVIPLFFIVIWAIFLWKTGFEVVKALVYFAILFVIWIVLVFAILSSCM